MATHNRQKQRVSEHASRIFNRICPSTWGDMVAVAIFENKFKGEPSQLPSANAKHALDIDQAFNGDLVARGLLWGAVWCRISPIRHYTPGSSPQSSQLIANTAPLIKRRKPKITHRSSLAMTLQKMSSRYLTSYPNEDMLGSIGGVHRRARACVAGKLEGDLDYYVVLTYRLNMMKLCDLYAEIVRGSRPVVPCGEWDGRESFQWEREENQKHAYDKLRSTIYKSELLPDGNMYQGPSWGKPWDYLAAVFLCSDLTAGQTQEKLDELAMGMSPPRMIQSMYADFISVSER